jgi:hypothetical protein
MGILLQNSFVCKIFKCERTILSEEQKYLNYFATYRTDTRAVGWYVGVDRRVNQNTAAFGFLDGIVE